MIQCQSLIVLYTYTKKSPKSLILFLSPILHNAATPLILPSPSVPCCRQPTARHHLQTLNSSSHVGRAWGKPPWRHWIALCWHRERDHWGEGHQRSVEQRGSGAQNWSAISSGKRGKICGNGGGHRRSGGRSIHDDEVDCETLCSYGVSLQIFVLL